MILILVAGFWGAKSFRKSLEYELNEDVPSYERPASYTKEFWDAEKEKIKNYEKQFPDAGT